MSGEDDDAGLRAVLGTLRQDLPQDDFDARLHRRLAAAGAPRDPSRGAALLSWLRERPWLVGAAVGSACGVAAFALSAALAGGERAEELQPRAQAAASTAPVCPEPALAALPVAVETTAEVFVVPMGKVAMVQLHFAVDEDVELAEFSVMLPEGLSFFSEGAVLPERVFHWQAPLRSGDNTVPVAVLGVQPGHHTLAATATIAGEVVVHQIVLDVKEPA